MKSIFPFFVMILFLSLSEKNYAQELNSAAKNIYNKIIFIEGEYKKYKQGKPADFQYVNEIVELSEIKPKDSHENYFGTFYTPDESNIKLWKEWFEKNSALFSNYQNDDVTKYYFSNKKDQIVRFEYDLDKFRYSYSQAEMKYILEVTERIKQSQISLNKK